MIRFVAGRLFQGFTVIFAVATLTFALLQLAPGDPFSTFSESPRTSQRMIEQMREHWGLDQPVLVQFGRYLSNLAQGDLGHSFTENGPVWNALRDAFPRTLLLALAALVVDFVVGVSLGTIQGSRPGTALDRLLSAGSLTLYSTPVFWLGLVALVLFGQKLGWLPAGGMRDLGMWNSLSPAGRVLDVLRHLVLPAVTLGLVGAAGTARYQRAQLLEVIRQDYVRTARAKGLTERAVVFRHALRNALLPTITLLGLSLPALLSGAVLVESVFAWPGMGLLTVSAILGRDYFLVTGAAMLAAALVVAGNFLADILARAADPRTRPAG